MKQPIKIKNDRIVGRSMIRAITAAGLIIFPGVSVFGAQNFTNVIATIGGRAGLTGSANGSGTNALFNTPHALAADAAGNLYVADQINHTIRKLTPTGTNWLVSTIAGKAGVAGSTDGAGTNALFSYPAGVAVDASNNVFVADEGNQTIRKLTSSGTAWTVSTIAGLAGSAGSTDGTNNAARFSSPSGLAVDTNGDVFVADWGNHTIRELIPASATTWNVSTIAGLAGSKGNSDGTNNSARFNHPEAVALDASGDVFVADWGNHTIRELVRSAASSWNVSTIAGSTNYGSADGIGTAAQFYYPSGLALDGAGNIYVADTFNDTIREMSLAAGKWTVVTIAGAAGVVGSGDGIGTSSRFYNPCGVAVDTFNNIFVADTGNQTIRGPSSPLINIQPQNQIVPVGSNVLFSVSVTGSFPLSYQWMQNGTNIMGATNATLTLTNLQTSVSALYSVLVSNPYGSVASLNAQLTVIPPPGINFFEKVTNTDFTAVGYGGMRGSGVGTITLTNVSGMVKQALLFWHGPGNSISTTANATVNFAGTVVTGVSIGFSSDNGWSFNNSQAYRADVTSLVTGNGTYALTNFYKGSSADVNGASLIVFYDDGNPANNRDVYLYDGNDSNLGSTYDPPNWSLAMTNLVYASNTNASLTLHVSDGQSYADASVLINGAQLLATGNNFSGDSVPNGPSASINSGGLWDIKTYDVTSFLAGGTNSLILTSGINSDYLSLVVATLSFPSSASLSPTAPGISTQPQSLTVTNGNPASFTVGAFGTQPLFYQWQFNGTNLSDGGVISGSATNNLLLKTVTTNYAGNYQVIITNAYGSVTSSVATLTVTVVPVAVSLSTNVSEYGNENLCNTGTYSSDPKAGATLAGLAPGAVTYASQSFVHSFPFSPTANDYPGTDQIYVGSKQTAFHDGYSSYSGRLNGPQVITLNYSSLVPSGQTIATLTLGVGADDFQFSTWGNPFTAMINGVTNAALTAAINGLTQTGPYEQFLTVGIDPTILQTNGVLTLSIDEGGDGGDGWAIDFLTVGVTTISNSPPAIAVAPPSGLVAWWPGNGNALDIVDGNNGTLTGGVTYTNGKVGQAFSLDGSSGYVVAPASASLNVGLASGFTIEGWIDPTTIAEQPIVEWNNGGNNGVHLWISVPPSVGTGPGCLYANVVDTTGTGHIFASPAGLIATNSFQYVALTYDTNSGLAVLYINGASVAQQNLGVFTPQTSYNVYLGDRPGGLAPIVSYGGLLDEISIYNRALSSNEIAAIYVAGSAGKISNQPYFLTTTNLPNGAVGVSYSQTITASVTTGNTYSLTGGSLPAGLNLSTNGLISGTPATVGTNSFTILATSSLGQTSSQTFTLVTGPAQNLLVNGGFENEPNWGGGVGSDGSYTAFIGNQIPGWTIETNHAVTIHISPGSYLTISGNYSANTDGEGYNGHNANFYQDFASQSGASYALEFNWQSWGAVGTPTTNKLEISLTDTNSGTVLFDGLYSYDGTGQPHPVHDVLTNFVGTGNPLRLRIQETPESDYNDNTFIVDNFSVTAVPAVAVTPPAGLVSWWRAESNALDSVGMNNGALVNNATYAPGEVGTAFSFGGTNDYVSVPSAPALNPTNAITIEAWVYANGTPAVASGIAGNWDDLTGNNRTYLFWLYGGRLGFYISHDGTGYTSVADSTPLPTNSWVHVAATYDGTNMVIYRNGVQVGLTVYPGIIATNSRPFFIGRTDGGGVSSEYWNGLIDELSLYNRALSSNEIAAIYSAGSAGKFSTKPYFLTAINLPNGLTGFPYSQTVSAGVTTGNTFSLVGGSLPAGLNLSTNGLISGTPAAAGTNSFTILATSALGQTNSQTFVLAVFAPPVISAQPPLETVTNGSPAYLAVGVSGAAPLFYQWQKNGVNLTDGRIISGSATSTLSLLFATTADAGNYSVIITNAYGSVTSSVVALTIIPATNQFNISLPLSTGSGNKLDLGFFAGGQALQLSFVGNGDLVNSTYQTLPDGSMFAPAGSPYGYGNPGANYPTNAGGDGINHYPGGGGNYDAGGGSGFPFAGKMTTDTTDPAGIRDGAVVGTFNPSPANTNWFYIGYGGTFTVPAGGAHLYVAVNDSVNSDDHGVYLGVLNGAVPAFSTTNLLLNPGAEAGTLTNWTVGGSSNPNVDNGTFDTGINPHTGAYDFYGGNGSYGSLSQTVSLIGNQGITAAMIDNSNLVASISFWEQGLNQGAPSDDANVSVTFFGASSNVLNTVSTPVLDSHNNSWSNYANQYAIPSGTRFIQYTMNFYRNYGTALDAFIDDNYLSIVQPLSAAASSPVISSQPQSLMVTNGNPAAFAVTAAGSPPLAYQWRKNGTNLFNGVNLSNLSGATTNVLLLNAAAANDAGSYSVVITNAYGSVTSSVALLTVIPAGSSTTNGTSFTVLHTFSALAVGTPGNADGANPYAGVTGSGGRIYGVTELGGASGFGTIFAMDTNGANFNNLYNFGANGGQNPVGDLNFDSQQSSMIYGTTSTDATNGAGTVFAISTNGSGFRIIHQFSSAANDGKTPMARLLISGSGSLLYGTTEYGGSNNLGTVFVVNTNGSGFTVLHSFASGEGSPSSDLSLSGNTLYGSAVNGGSFSQGTLFAVNTNGTGFTNFYSFTGGGDGGSPRGRLLILNNMLFGTTSSGGTNSSGTVFAFNLISNSVQVLHTFSITNFADGAVPVAGLVGSANSNALYGTTSSGGTNVAGTIFSINTDGSGFAPLHDFVSSPDGSVPSSRLALSGNTLYGTALEGGTNGEGTVFALTLPGVTASPVQISSTQASGGSFNLSFPSVSGQNYTLYYNDNLATTNWLPYTNVSGNGGTLQLTVPTTNSVQRFFRISEP
jgi:uncharacterized repeat protein (TIGR03803 family)